MKNNRRQFLTSMSSIAGLSVLPGSMALAATAKAPYKDATLPVQQRVDDLLGRMTLEEKIMQMQCTWQQKTEIQDAKGEFSPAKAQKVFPNGLGMIARPSDRQLGQAAGAGDTGAHNNRSALETATYVNAIQKWAVEQTRLGIPLFMHEESLHGYVARDATSFPQAIGLASSFDPTWRAGCSAWRRARCARAAPTWRWRQWWTWRANRAGAVSRKPMAKTRTCAARWARPPCWASRARASRWRKDKVYATLKHMTGHGQPESGTNIGPAEVSERTLREEFFPPFEKLIRETNVAAVMPSYNEIGGVPSHANHWLITNVLRKEWGFKGVTVSDYLAVNELVTRHKLAATPKEAALAAR
jgi:beta-glucosidase